MTRLVLCFLIQVVMVLSVFSQQVNNNIVFIGEKSLIRTLDVKLTNTDTLLDAFDRKAYDSLLVDDELLTATLERIKSLDLKDAHDIIISTGRTNQKYDLLAGFDDTLAKCISLLHKNETANIYIIQSTNQLDARYLGVMYTVSEELNSRFIPMNQDSFLLYGQEIKRVMSQPEKTIDKDGYILGDNNVLASVPEIATESSSDSIKIDARDKDVMETNTMHLKMSTPDGIKSFDSTDKVGITRRTIKKHLSVSR